MSVIYRDRSLLLATCLTLALLTHMRRAKAAAACGGEGQQCCQGPKLRCSGDFFCDAPQCKLEASKCWRLPKYPDECGVAGKPCCPLFKCTDSDRWPKDFPSGHSASDGFACKEGATCNYGADSSKGWSTTLCEAGGSASSTATAGPGTATKTAEGKGPVTAVASAKAPKFARAEAKAVSGR